MASDLSSPAPEQQSICTECALCCNGVLFDFVPAGTAEQPRLTKLGFGLRPKDGAAVFDQPCPMLIGSLCSVYGEHPDTCRGYRCQLLMKHQRGDVSRDERWTGLPRRGRWSPN
ncbi:MAG: YkgJ family cysteine cluster protein [Sphingomicrobium sp.]